MKLSKNLNRVEEVKRKREFSKLPDSVVERALEKRGGNVKEARAFLRKYFGVFLTNKVLKGVGKEVLEKHISSKRRDYDKLYGEIFEEKKPYRILVDFGCGVNGLTFPLLQQYGVGEYLGFEASGQVVELVNHYFDEGGYGNVANVVWMDIFNSDKIISLVKKTDSPRVAFLFQIVDAMEQMEKDFSKKFLSEISPYFELLVISLSMKSLGGGKRFEVSRKWLVDFLKENFDVVKDFEMCGERVLLIKGHILN